MNAAKKKTPFQLKKEAEERKKRIAEEEAAKVYEEFVAHYEDDPSSKTFVRSGSGGAAATAAAAAASSNTSDYGPPPGSSNSSNKRRKMWGSSGGSGNSGGGGGGNSVSITGRSGSARAMFEADDSPPPVEKKVKKPKVYGAVKKKSKMELLMEKMKESAAAKDAGTGGGESLLGPSPSMDYGRGGGGSGGMGMGGNSAVGPPLSGGSFDDGSGMTTNLFVGNLSRQMNENALCVIFGKYGPLASVKIMWPRTEEQKASSHMVGFVAFMKRADGAKALRELNGKPLVPGFEVKLGWGKPLAPFPKVPFYVHHESKEGIKMKTNLPFNAKQAQVVAIGECNTVMSQAAGQESTIETATVTVVVPVERVVRQLIHRTIEFVVREGPAFEALLVTTYKGDDKFDFLSDYSSHDHIYYRWKLFSILQGDRATRWKKDTFIMYRGGSIWRPPEEDQVEKLEEVTKGQLSHAERDVLEDHLRNITAERKLVAAAMVWCLKHADAAEEVVECISESLSILDTPIGVKIARLFLVSDILHNCSAPVRNASFYRNKFEAKLPSIFKALHEAYNAISSRMRAEKFRKDVTSCLGVWQEWNVFTPNLFSELDSAFTYGNTQTIGQVAGGTVAGTQGNSVLIKFQQTDANAGSVGVGRNRDGRDGGRGTSAAADDDDDDDDDDVDGVPLDDDEDLDGMPFDNTDLPAVAPSSKQKLSKWELMDLEN